jgi:hypothetical protein
MGVHKMTAPIVPIRARSSSAIRWGVEERFKMGREESCDVVRVVRACVRMSSSR